MNVLFIKRYPEALNQMNNCILSKEETLKFVESNPRQRLSKIKYNIIFLDFLNKNFNNTITKKISEKIYQYVNNINEIPVCLNCGSNIKTFHGISQGYANYCSLKCSNSCGIIKDKKQNSMLKKYGITHNFSGKFGDRKCDKTLVENFGDLKTAYDVRNDKSKETCLTKYGIENPSQLTATKTKVKQTKLQKYGDENYCNVEKIRENIIKRYANDENWQHRNSSYKKYKLPSGKMIYVQGYEPYALDYLLKTYNENEIICEKNKIPKFEYSLDNKNHYYFPDLYIPKENLVIEIKSHWTLNKHINEYILKKDAVLKQNRNFLLLIFQNKGKLLKNERTNC